MPTPPDDLRHVDGAIAIAIAPQRPRTGVGVGVGIDSVGGIATSPTHVQHPETTGTFGAGKDIRGKSCRE